MNAFNFVNISTVPTTTTKTNKTTSTTNQSNKHIVGEIMNFIYRDTESGFYVANIRIPNNHSALNEYVDNEHVSGRNFKVVGTSTYVVEQIKEKQEVNFYGNFEVNKQGLQFKCDSVIEIIPTKPKAIELFLSSGKIKGIGPAIAKKIVDTYGSNTIDIFDNDIQKLLTISGITDKKLGTIKDSWKSFRNIFEIISTMQSYGIGDSNAVKIHSYFKEKSIEIIKTDPYRLTEVPNIGFKTADKIALNMGIGYQDPKRIRHCILFALEQLSDDGHTAFVHDDLINKVSGDLDLDYDTVDGQLNKLIKDGLVISKKIFAKRNNPNQRGKFTENIFPVISHIKYDRMEQTIANELLRILKEKKVFSNTEVSQYIGQNTFKLDQSQLQATSNIFQNKVSVLTGGPGTGKTHTIKTILNFYKLKGMDCVLAAPTGRAAKRMEEATGTKAPTIHRILGYSENGFVFNESNQLKGDIFILDESSMIDTSLIAAFLRAIPSKATLIFVGDIDQLYSVGPGTVLKDLINSGYIAVSRLNEIHRQAKNSNIIKSSHEIIKHIMPSCLKDNNPDSDFIFIPVNQNYDTETENNEIYNSILYLVDELINTGKFKKDEIQILAPRKDGVVGVENFNRGLKLLLNYDEAFEKNKDIPFTIGDRVMQTKNNYDLDIFNGDIGSVVFYSPEDGYATIDFDGKLVDLTNSEIKDVKLAFAMSIHKSQGSDFPCVISPMSRSHTYMMDTNLFYTGVTRAKKQYYAIGSKVAMQNTVSSLNKTFRMTGLKNHISAVFEKANMPVVYKSNDYIAEKETIDKLINKTNTSSTTQPTQSSSKSSAFGFSNDTPVRESIANTVSTTATTKSSAFGFSNDTPVRETNNSKPTNTGKSTAFKFT